MWGIIPAAGIGSRIQPLAFSKELLPVGSRADGPSERPRAVSEYLVERMLRAGANKLCFVISPGKSDIVEYFGGGVGAAHVCYAVQQRPAGLCDALFRALPFVAPEEDVLVGLPDTVWFPDDGFCRLGRGLSFLLFQVERPQADRAHPLRASRSLARARPPRRVRGHPGERLARPGRPCRGSPRGRSLRGRRHLARLPPGHSTPLLPLRPLH